MIRCGRPNEGDDSDGEDKIVIGDSQDSTQCVGVFRMGKSGMLSTWKEFLIGHCKQACIYETFGLDNKEGTKE